MYFTLCILYTGIYSTDPVHLPTLKAGDSITNCYILVSVHEECFNLTPCQLFWFPGYHPHHGICEINEGPYTASEYHGQSASPSNDNSSQLQADIQCN